MTFQFNHFGSAGHKPSSYLAAAALALAAALAAPLGAESLPAHLAKSFFRDQKVIWTKPLHLSAGQLAGVAVFSAATAALIATDRRTSADLPNTPAQIDAGQWVSDAGIGIEGAIAGGLLLAGHFRRQNHAFETGVLAAEAAADSFVVGEAVKLVAERQRPYQDQGRGHFFAGGSSFPSGHAIISWTMAEIFAEEYPGRPTVRIGAYGLAAAISAARFPARKHFLSDIVAGGTAGFLIGRYVWRAHHGEPGRWSRLSLPALGYNPRLRSYTVTVKFAM